MLLKCIFKKKKRTLRQSLIGQALPGLRDCAPMGPTQQGLSLSRPSPEAAKGCQLVFFFPPRLRISSFRDKAVLN